MITASYYGKKKQQQQFLPFPINNDYNDSGKSNNITNCCLTELVVK